MRRIDELHLEHPFAGSRMLRDFLSAKASPSAADHVATLDEAHWGKFEAIYRRRNSLRNPLPGHKIYPYSAARA